MLSIFYSLTLSSSHVIYFIHQIRSDQSLSRVRLFATPWITACQASLSITNSQSSLRLMSIESVMPSSHLILCRPLSLLPPIPPSIRVFSNESTLHMRWPKYIVVYICQYQSPNPSHVPFPSWYPNVFCSLGLCLYFCFANKFIYIIILDATYMH